MGSSRPGDWSTVHRGSPLPAVVSRRHLHSCSGSRVLELLRAKSGQNRLDSGSRTPEPPRPVWQPKPVRSQRMTKHVGSFDATGGGPGLALWPYAGSCYPPFGGKLSGPGSNERQNKITGARGGPYDQRRAVGRVLHDGIGETGSSTASIKAGRVPHPLRCLRGRRRVDGSVGRLAWVVQLRRDSLGSVAQVTSRRIRPRIHCARSVSVAPPAATPSMAVTTSDSSATSS